LPAFVGHGDHCGLKNGRVGHQRAFEVHRTDPLPAGLDDVLGAVADRHESFAVHRADVAGAQPSVVEPLGGVDAEIRTGNPGTPDLELADGLSIARKDRPVVGRNAYFDTGDDATGLDAIVNLRVRRRTVRRYRHRGQGTGLSHPPTLDHVDAESIAECFDHHARHGRATGDDAPKAREISAGIALRDAEHVVPNGRDAEGDGGSQLLNHLDDRFTLQEHLGHDQLGSGEERRVGRSPGVDVKHRNDQETAIALTESDRIGGHRGHRVQPGRTM
jgi:hypothetical protein